MKNLARRQAAVTVTGAVGTLANSICDLDYWMNKFVYANSSGRVFAVIFMDW
ncbi:hypothetical protein OWT26_14750 [Burkholderia sp. 1A5]